MHVRLLYKVTFLLLWMLLFGVHLAAQKSYPYNLSTLNGMPTNYVYMTLTDKWGYLWMATEKGVVKYNGYSLRIFNYADGLVNEDIYGLQKDATGRIWLYNFSGKVCYIKDDRISVPRNADSFLFRRIHNMTPYRDGILFISESDLYAVRGDSIMSLHCKADMVNRLGEVFQISDTAITKYVLKNYQVNFEKSCHVATNIKMYKIPLGQKFLFYSRSSSVAKVFDPRYCTIKDVRFYNEKGTADTIWFMTYSDNWESLVLGNSHIYESDTNLNIRRTAIRSLIDRQGNLEVTSFTRDSLWGACLSTRRNGLYIIYPKMQGVKVYTAMDMQGYKPLGMVGDTMAYWWNSTGLMLAKIAKGKIETRRKTEALGAKAIIPANDHYSYFLGASAIDIIDNHSIKFSNYVKTYFIDGRIIGSGKLNGFARDMIMIDSSYGFVIYNIFLGKIKHVPSNDTLHVSKLDSGMYNALYYDSTRSFLVAWGNDILIYNIKTHKRIKIPSSYLIRHSIYNVKGLFFDQVGKNIILQDHNAVYFYDLQRHRLVRVLRNLNMEDARVIVKDGRLIAAGKFGIAVCALTGHTRISTPTIYSNAKEQYYSEITGIQLMHDALLVNTDRYLYSIDLQTAGINEMQHNYRLLCNYEDSLFEIRKGDTLRIKQTNKRIQYDVVNAYGSGTLKFAYQVEGLDSVWNRLVANELVVPDLNAGKYHKMLLSVSDNAWNNDPVTVYLYIEPYWWQTTVGRNGIWTGSILLLIGLLLSVFGITRSVIVRNNKKRNRLLELEIKSVYAQINPHFIFNSLNAALSYIELDKSKEAYEHISRFSGLLRSFLKSSRNRYVTIAEEVTHLRNYIELQQARFADAFSYEISIEQEIDKEQTLIPSLLLQPLVENAINHGLLPKEGVGCLVVTFRKGDADNIILCLIDDNGVGREEARKRAERLAPRTSYGSLLIHELIDIFNKYEKVKIDINYIDKRAPETGLTVILTFIYP